MSGFFSLDQISKKVESSIPDCNSCQLYKSCNSPKMPYSGKGKQGILICGEAPGKCEDEKGIQFIGRAGELLENSLSKFGYNLRDDFWITNSVICRPQKNKLPPKAIDYCRPNLINTIKELNPRTVIVLGASSLRSLAGWLWHKNDIGSLGRWLGWKIPSQQINAWVCPNWHPAYFLHKGTNKKEEGNVEVAKLLFEKYLQNSLELKDRPWDKVIDYSKQVRIIYEEENAKVQIENFADSQEIAFDLETNMIKPDSPNARIVSCAISDGRRTIAFPWFRSCSEATGRLLFDKNIGKLGWNIKFEDRWIRKEFGRSVRNWIWDGMIASHVLDNRKKICGLKFQSFVNLGISSYNNGVDEFLKADGSNVENKIKKADLGILLKYNGMDALLTFLLSKKLREMTF